MRIRTLVKKYWKTACVIVGCWTFLALLFTPQTYLSNLRAPTPLTWSQALGATLALFYVWAALTPLVLWLGGRFAFERPRLLRNLLIHLLLCVPISLAHIFVTAYNEYAIQAFEVNALDYLLKPVDCERLSKAVQRAKTHLAQPAQGGDLDSRFRAMLDDIKTGSKFLKRLTIKLTGRTILLPVDEIDWIETYGNYLKIHAGRESHLIRGTMQSLETKLDPEKFVRVHRSVIVNIEKVKEIYPRSNGDQDLVLQNGQQLMLSRNFRDRFFAVLGEL